MRRAPCVVALAVAFSAAAPARADWAYTRWGMTLEAVVAASRGAVRALPAERRRPVPSEGMEWRASGTYAEGRALRLRVAFAFDTRSGGLVCINYAVADGPRQNGALRDWLIARYGMPEGPEGRDIRVAAEATDLTWRRGTDEIDGSFDRGAPAEALHCRRR
jgi:hypothetical protein